MTKFLHYSFLLFSLLTINLVFSQSNNTINHSNHEQEHNLLPHSCTILLHNTMIKQKRDFSYDLLMYSTIFEVEHNHINEVALLDIISSDEGADFNCSGGFCMNKSHFHKKGLTLKKQFFDYFMSITC
ncbi:hypothetical protein [Aquimarina sediminis]|uniref:hypothetical protein n=1 Tax=Aquimarina sediminis TaxID=2070536 RepID=UPI000FFE5ED7|nr:hypothetical protein [Aquimarina sediminis]